MKVQSRFDNKKIGELVCDGAMKFVDNFAVEINGERVAEYESLDAVAKDWKDYKPLIEDPKIRRELSEWIALYGEHEKIKYYRYNDFVVFRLSRKRGTPEPEITLPIIYGFGSLREGKEYTKPELCGEEAE